MKPIQIVAGVAAGLVGAILWAAVAYFAHLEIGYIAWAIGLAVGIAVATTGDSGKQAGAVAVLITFVALLAGKFGPIAFEQQTLEDTSSLADSIHITDDNLQDHLAQQIVAERQAAGELMHLPKMTDVGSFALRYPKDVWKQAGERLAEIPDEQKQTLRAEQKAKLLAEIEGAHDDHVEQTGFANAFSIFDLVFFGLAIATTWGVATRQEVE